MKNHFVMSYVGNKRNELDFLDNINLDNIKYCVEPFCGSCAFSFKFWLKTKNNEQYKNVQYILNDIDTNLIRLLEAIRDEKKEGTYEKLLADLEKAMKTITKQKYYQISLKQRRLDKTDYSLIDFLIFNKCFNIRPGTFNLETDFKTKSGDIIEKMKFAPIVDFLKNANIIILNTNACNIFNEYSSLEGCLMYLDPPYCLGYNDLYAEAKIEKIYTELFNDEIKKKPATILFHHENNFIGRLLGEKYMYLVETKDKVYEMTKKKTSIILLSNKILYNNFFHKGI